MSKPNPPRWGDWLIERLCATHLIEEFQGDLHEAFHWRVAEKGIVKARWLFVFEVLRTIRFSHLKPTHYFKQYLTMYRNYLKTGWRFIGKHKLYSSLNIFGLALGISFCWMAYLYAHDETSFDRHLPDQDRLYRITIDVEEGDNQHHIGGSSHAMSVTFAESIPEIEEVAKFKSGYGLIQKGEEVLEQSLIRADRSMLDFLNLDFVEGAPGAFDQPNDVVISTSLAGRLDLRGKAVGTVLTLIAGQDSYDFIIRAVYSDIPENTSIRRNMIVSYAHYISIAPERRLQTWMDINMNTLVKLREQASLSEAERKMNEIHLSNDDPQEGVTLTMQLQPISDIHLNEVYGHYNGISRGGNPELIRLFAVIGVFCLWISMINYSNFAVSLYISRAREIALRKVIGAERRGIFSQLITESFLSSVLSGALAILLLIGLLPVFSEFVQKEYTLAYLIRGPFLLGAAGLLVATGLFSGIYPAWVLSRFAVIKSLRGEQKIHAGKWITQSLMTLQFVIATVLVAGMLTLHGQVRYLTTFDTKIDPENVISFGYIPKGEAAIRSFVEAVAQLPEVQQAAAISGYNGTRLKEPYTLQQVRHLRIHQDLMGLLDIDVVQGRKLDPSRPSDHSNSILVNQVLVEVLNLEQPIGEVLPFEYGDLKNPTIVGVVEDYHFESVKSTVDPLVIYLAPEYPLQSVYLRMQNTRDFNAEKLEALWNEYMHPFPCDYTFLSADYDREYAQEQRMMKLVSVGCFVSIFLAAMGLLGIVGLQLNQRLKEISIRKVLGASFGNLYRVFSQRFILLILVGLSAGLLLSYILIKEWLSNYPFHIEFGTGLQSVTALLTLSIALFTISSQVIHVARGNPAKYLKDE
ncbi:MAG: ABC transporter permease [Bacteroidota bacterium]